MIPVFKPSIGEEEVEALREVLDSGWIGLGPRTEVFERKFAEYVGANWAIGTNSGTAALHLALKAFGVRTGDEVVLPSLTFISCAHAVLYCGAKPVFADVYEDTLTLDADDVQKKVTEKTKVIMPMHYGGHPCDMAPILEIAKDKGIIVIEDAAHACGAEYKGKKIGSIGDATCFSFHAVKNLTTGEGGMITTQREDIAEKLKKLRWLGISKGTWDRYSPSQRQSITSTPRWYYEVEELGYKAHMSDIQAAIGIVQLSKLDKMNRRRKEIARIYDENFSKLEWIEVPTVRDYAKHAYHLYVIKVENRNDLISYMFQNGVATSVHYMPIHLHPFYRKFRAKIPVTENIWRKLVTLPMFPDLDDCDLERIVRIVKNKRNSLEILRTPLQR